MNSSLIMIRYDMKIFDFDTMSSNAKRLEDNYLTIGDQYLSKVGVSRCFFKLQYCLLAHIQRYQIIEIDHFLLGV